MMGKKKSHVLRKRAQKQERAERIEPRSNVPRRTQKEQKQKPSAQSELNNHQKRCTLCNVHMCQQQRHKGTPPEKHNRVFLLHLPVRPVVRPETVPFIIRVVALVPVSLGEHLHAIPFSSIVSPLPLIAIAILVNVHSVALDPDFSLNWIRFRGEGRGREGKETW